MNKKLLMLILLLCTAGLFGGRGGGRRPGGRGPGGRSYGGWHHGGYGRHDGYRGRWRDNRWIIGPTWWPGAMFGGIFYDNYYNYCLATGLCAPGWAYWA